jgi:MFS family permease
MRSFSFEVLIQLNSRVRLLSFAYLTLLFYSIASTVSFNGPVMPLYVDSLGIGVIGWSVLVAVQAIGMFLAEWIWGSLSDRTDRRLLMLVSVLAMSVLSLLYSFRQLVPVFMVLEFLTGVLFVAIGPLSRSYVSDASPEKSIGLYASLWWMFFVLGRVVGPLLGSYIAQTWAFEYSFWATSLMSLLLAVFILVSFPSERARHQVPKADMVSTLKRVLSRRSAMLLFLSAAFIFTGRTLVSSFLPLYASQEIKMSTVDVGVLFASVSAAQLVTMPIVGWLSDRFGRRRTTVLGLIATSGLFLLYFLADTSYQVLAVSVAVGMGFSGTSLLLAIIPDVTPTAMQGATIGIYGSFEDLGVIVGPLLFGFVWSTIGPVYIFAAASITQLIGAVLVYRIKQTRQERTRSG